jgi:hypothetical protein
VSNAAEVLIFNRSGSSPLEVRPQIEAVAWRLNRTGQTRMYLPYSDPECTPDNLALGNRVLIQFENGLRAFGGVIDVPRRRTSTGVNFTVYTGDRILGWRRTQKTAAYTSVAPGVIFRSLINSANLAWDTGIALGSVYAGGTARSETYHLAGVLDALWELARLSGEEFRVVPVFESGRLTFEASWDARIGEDLSETVLLAENLNIEPPQLDEQGPIASVVKCAGGGAGGTTWGDRLVGEDSSVASRNAYGYREYAEVLTGIFDQATLDASATSLLDEYNDPRPRYTLVALDRAPAGFELYDVGDDVRVQAFLRSALWAVDESVRLVGREWAPDNRCRLEVR